MSLRGWISRVVRGTWWVSVVWLALAAVGILYYLVLWLTDKENPARYEYAIGSGVVLTFAFPAILGLLIAALVPRTGLSLRRRLGGVLFILLCFGVVILFDYLQVKYR